MEENNHGSSSWGKDDTFVLIVGLTLILATFYWIYIKIIRKDPRAEELMRKLPGPKIYPIIGNAFELVVPNDQIIQINIDQMKKYGNIARGWLFNQAYIFIGESKYVEKLLSSNTHIDKSDDYEFLQSWLGTGLLTSQGRKWHSRRKLLTPTFHFKILEDFIYVFNEQGSILTRIMEGRAERKEIFDIFPYIARCTLDIICETAMGEKLNAQKNSDSEYVKAVYSFGEILLRRIVDPWLRSELIWKLMYGRKEKKFLKTLHDFSEGVIRQRRKDRLSAIPQRDNQSTAFSGRRRLAFLDLLLEVSEDGQQLTDVDVREETDTFMFEGQDTTAASVSWTIYLLGTNRECQERVREELFKIVGDDPDKTLTLEDLSRMKYLELCIKESLRLYPSVPYFARQLFKELDLGEDKILPVGSRVFVTTYSLHRDPKVFPNPEQFIPERFEPQNSIGRSPYAYVPFSAGPRNCIGQKFAMLEEKVLLAKIFLNYEVTATEKLENIQLVPDLILRPKNGLPVILRKI
jgi:cytochrome P450